MTAYTVAANDLGKYEKTLAANTEDTVTFGADLTRVEILHHGGAAPIYIRFGGAATVAGDNCRLVMPGTSIITEPPTSGATTVSVISAAAATYSVTNGD